MGVCDPFLGNWVEWIEGGFLCAKNGLPDRSVCVLLDVSLMMRVLCR